jgi:hypothetical protein
MKKRLISLCMCLALSAVSNAEVVRVPLGEQADDSSVVKPQRGLSTRGVEAEFGSPISRHGPVGDPAIYYWEYDQFTVYFEDSYVIHSVSKVKSKTPVKR